MDKLTRRNIRYICFRIQNEILGGAKAEKEDGIMQFVYEIKDHMESQEDFGGWDKFAKTWDVDDKAPLVVVSRTSSIQSQWNTILKEETKELPAEKEEREKKEADEKKLLTNKLSEAVQEIKAEQESIVENTEETAEKPDKKSASKKDSFWDKLH